MYSNEIIRNVTVVLDTEASKKSYPLSAQQELVNLPIVGLFVRRQSTADDKYATNDLKLIADKDLNSAYLKLKVDGSDVIYKYPLEHAAFTETGSFLPVSLPKGIQISTSSIQFYNAGTDASRAIEIIFLTDQTC